MSVAPQLPAYSGHPDVSDAPNRSFSSAAGSTSQGPASAHSLLSQADLDTISSTRSAPTAGPTSMSGEHHMGFGAANSAAPTASTAPVTLQTPDRPTAPRGQGGPGGSAGGSRRQRARAGSPPMQVDEAGERMQGGDSGAGPEGGSNPQPTYLVSFTLPEPRTATTPLDSPPRRVLPIRGPISDNDHARPRRPPGTVRRPRDLRFVDADRSRLIAQPGSEPNSPSMILTPRAFYPQRGTQILAHNDGLAVDIAPAHPPPRAVSPEVPALSALPDAALTDPDMSDLESYTPELTHNVPPPLPAHPRDASAPDRRVRMIGPFAPGEWYWTRVPRVFDPPDLVDQELALFDLGVAAMKQAFSRSTIYVKARPGLSYDPPRQSDPHDYRQSATSAVAAGASTRAQQHDSHRHAASAGDRPVPPPAVRNDWPAPPRWTAVAEVPAAAFNADPRGEPTAHTATGQPRVVLSTRCIPCGYHGRVCDFAYPCGPCIADGLACDL